MNEAAPDPIRRGGRPPSRWLLPCLGVLLTCSTVEAQERPGPQHHVSVTFSTLHLVFGALELSGEFRLHPRVSAAALGGFGLFGRSLNVEVGGQLRVYVLGSFDHGLNLSVESLFVPGATDVSGIYVNPFAGYKFVARVGFTVEVHAGLRLHAARAFESEESRVAPWINLRLGWSF